MSYIHSKKIIPIDSNLRLNGTHDDFSYSIDLLNEEYDMVCLLKCLLPKTYYLIREGQNTFTLTEGVDVITVTVPAGNYDRKSFALQVGLLLTNASLNGITYSVSIPSRPNPETGKYTFTVTNNGVIQPIFTFSRWVYEQFGFDANSSNQFVNDILVSKNVAKMQSEDCIYIRSDITKDTLLQDVYVSQSADFSSVSYLCPEVESHSRPMHVTKNGAYRFTFTDEQGNKIDFNGQNIVMSIVVYKESTIYKALKGFINYIMLLFGQSGN